MASNQGSAMNVEVIVPSQADELRKRADTALTAANLLVIESPEDYLFAADELKRVKTLAGGIDSMRKSITVPLDEAKKKVMDMFRPSLAALSEAEGLLKRCMLAYDDEQERKRREAQRAFDEQARKERERLQKRAEAAAAKGQAEKAEGLAIAAATTAPNVAASTAVAADGVSYRTKYDCEVVDIVELCAAVAAGTVAPFAVEANTKFLRKQAEALGEHFNIAGCKLKKSRIIAAKTR